MLDIGFSELLLIAVAALVLIGPKDLPVAIRHAAKLLRELRGFYLGIKKQVHGLVEEAGVQEVEQEFTTILDLEGKPQKAYILKESKVEPSPVKEAPDA